MSLPKKSIGRATGAFAEAFERNVKDAFRGMNTPNGVTKEEKIALEKDLKVDKYGTRVDKVEIGLSGKVLNDEFRFGPKEQKYLKPVESQNRQWDTSPNDPWNQSGPKQQTNQNIGDKGFLEFDSIFENKGANQPNNNPFN
jgi:hypothetical protein